MAKTNDDLREEAKKLRFGGESTPVIARLLGKSPSVIRSWVKDIPITEEMREKFKKRAVDARLNNRGYEKKQVSLPTIEFSKYRNTKKQGDAGLGLAIAWFSCNSETVCIPLTDSQDYDLVVDFGDGELKKVQVKTTSFLSPYGVYIVGISVQGGNRSGKSTCKEFDNTKVDFIFVVTGDGGHYLIPSVYITAKRCICLGAKFSKYRVG